MLFYIFKKSRITIIVIFINILINRNIDDNNIVINFLIID